MRVTELRSLILSDLYRVAGETTTRSLVRQLVLGDGFKYNVILRTCAFLRERERRTALALVYPPALMVLRHYKYKLGVDIDPATEIGSGLYIGHVGGIVVTHRARIGRDCNLSQGVTIGVTNRGSRAGAPVIGDRVYIGPGAKVLGAVVIGDDAAIGANCVVTRDVPSSAVVIGVPGQVVSTKGSTGYVNRVDYDALGLEADV